MLPLNKYNETSYPFVFLQVLFILLVPKNGPYKQCIIKSDHVFLVLCCVVFPLEVLQLKVV